MTILTQGSGLKIDELCHSEPLRSTRLESFYRMAEETRKILGSGAKVFQH